MKLRKVEGPGRCQLCRDEEENGPHLFLSAHLRGSVGKSAPGCWGGLANGKGSQLKRLGRIGFPRL